MSEHKLSIKYKFSEDYNPVYANGAIAGLSPTNEVTVHLYHERHGLPKESSGVIDDSGELRESVTEPKNHPATIVRMIQSGFVVNVESAIIIRDMLDKMIAAAMERQQGGAR